jgi:hypothetical protein
MQGKGGIFLLILVQNQRKNYWMFELDTPGTQEELLQTLRCKDLLDQEGFGWRGFLWGKHYHMQKKMHMQRYFP